MTRPEFDKQMRRLAGLKFSPSTTETHWLGLQDLSLDALTAAVEIAARTCDEFPSPHALRALAPREEWHCPHVVSCGNRWRCDQLLTLDPLGVRYPQTVQRSA